MENNNNLITDITADGLQNLCAAVVIQAIKDHQDLTKRNKKQRKDKKSGKYSKSEIAGFLNGDWCELMLCGVDADLCGNYILRSLLSLKPKRTRKKN